MSRTPDFDRIAATWLADGPTELADRVFDQTFEEIHRTRQRRRRTPWRPSTMTSTFKLLAAAAAVVAVVVTGNLVLSRGAPPSAGASPAPSALASPAGASSAASATPDASSDAQASPSAATIDLPASGRLEAGTFRTDLLDPAAQLTLPCCFQVDLHEPGVLVLSEVGRDRHLFLSTPSTVHDPASGDPAGVPDDLAAWFVDHPGLDTDRAQPVSMGGLDGQLVEGTTRTDAEYGPNGSIPMTSSGDAPGLRLFAGERFRIAVLETDADPVIVAVVTRADRWDEFEPLAQAALESLSFGN